MAAYNKFNVFTSDLASGYHVFGTHTFKAMLTNGAPVASYTVIANVTEITAQNGYSTGGPSVTMALSTASGVAKVTATDVVITASGGTIGPFRYVAIYNNTTSSPAKPVVAWFDYGSSITLNDTETFTLDFDGANGLFTIT